MSFDPSEFGLQALPHETEGDSGPLTMSNESMAARMEAMRLAAGGAQQAMTGPGGYVSPASRRLSNIEKRLLKAQYYRNLIEYEFFDNGDATSAEVEEEIRTFLISRMEALVGEEAQAPVAERFTPEEVQYLKLWAKTLKSKAEEPQRPPQPTVAPRPTPQAPVTRPAPPPPPPGPTLKTRKRSPVVSMPGEAPTRRTKKAVPGKVRPTSGLPQPIPVPSGAGMEAVMAQKAMLEASNARVIETNPDAPKR